MTLSDVKLVLKSQCLTYTETFTKPVDLGFETIVLKAVVTPHGIWAEYYEDGEIKIEFVPDLNTFQFERQLIQKDVVLPWEL